MADQYENGDISVQQQYQAATSRPRSTTADSNNMKSSSSRTPLADDIIEMMTSATQSFVVDMFSGNKSSVVADPLSNPECSGNSASTRHAMIGLGLAISFMLFLVSGKILCIKNCHLQCRARENFQILENPCVQKSIPVS